MTNRGRTDGLARALRLFSLVVLPFGIFWSAIGFASGSNSLAMLGLVAATFCAWLLLESRTAQQRTETNLAIRIATGTQVAALSAVVAEPMIGVAVAWASLIPVILALPYVRRASLSRTMAISAGVGAFALAAPALLPWGTRDMGSLSILLPISGLVTVYILFLLFLWNASTRMTDATSELRHVIEMSHDLAETLDPLDVGHALARHMAQVAHADDFQRLHFRRRFVLVLPFDIPAIPPFFLHERRSRLKRVQVKVKRKSVLRLAGEVAIGQDFGRIQQSVQRWQAFVRAVVVQ